jgi:transcriptional regulator with XRE-family HTH domain
MTNRPPYVPQQVLAQVLRELREEKGLSQKEFATSLGFSPSWLSRIESGDYDPPWSYICRVAKGLEISLGELEKAIDSCKGSLTSD